MAQTIQSRPNAPRRLKTKTKQVQANRESAGPIREAVVPAAKPSMAAQLRHRLQLTQALFARLLPVSLRSLANLESGAAPSEPVTRRLTELHRLTNALTEVMRKESVGNWLQTANPAFDGQKPLEVIERGESDRIWAMIYFLRSGVPS
jgi:DNA-binding transcriptional regulator YiaG